MRAAIMVAVLFRALDAYRIFDNIYIMTRGAQDTESVSFLTYRQIIEQFELGMGSALSVLLFLSVLLIALLLVKRSEWTWHRPEGRGDEVEDRTQHDHRDARHPGVVPAARRVDHHAVLQARGRDHGGQPAVPPQGLDVRNYRRSARTTCSGGR